MLRGLMEVTSAIRYLITKLVLGVWGIGYYEYTIPSTEKQKELS